MALVRRGAVATPLPLELHAGPMRPAAVRLAEALGVSPKVMASA